MADIDETIAAQGWTDASVLTLVWRYLEITGQIDAFAEFLAREAEEENAES